MSANDDLLPNCVKHAKVTKEIEDRLKERKKMEQRIIDGTELFIQACRNHDEIIGLDDLAELVDKAPTIEAIPVEWLHSIMEKQLIFAMTSEMEGTTTVQDGVIHCVSGALACQVLANVIELWEKENGKENN